MLINHLNKVMSGLLILAARLVTVSYADHLAVGDDTASNPSKSQAYLPLPPGR